MALDFKAQRDEILEALRGWFDARTKRGREGQDPHAVQDAEHVLHRMSLRDWDREEREPVDAMDRMGGMP